MESLGEIIKRTLKEKGIKESFVASKMNVSKQVINQIDRRKNFDLPFLQELKNITGLDFTNYLIPSENNTIVKEVEGEQTSNVSLNFKFIIPQSSYENISAFVKEVNELAEKYDLKIH